MNGQRNYEESVPWRVLLTRGIFIMVMFFYTLAFLNVYVWFAAKGLLWVFIILFIVLALFVVRPVFWLIFKKTQWNRLGLAIVFALAVNYLIMSLAKSVYTGPSEAFPIEIGFFVFSTVALLFYGLILDVEKEVRARKQGHSQADAYDELIFPAEDDTDE